LIMPVEKIIKKNIDLTPYTTWRIGGRAEFFAVVNNARELIVAVNWAKAKKLPVNVLAGGSNLLIVNQKIKGLVIKISGQDYSIEKNYLTCWGGTGLTKLAQVAAQAGLSGLEWACGIPGSVGGAVRGNAGAYGSDMAGAVAEVTAYDSAKGRLIKLNQRACGFAYRDSVFKTNNNLLIAGVKLKLAKGEPGRIKKIGEKYFRHRLKSKPKQPSAGCVFKNLPYQKAVKQNQRLAEALAAQGLVRHGKIAAGYLIDRLGFKGLAKGGAKVSRRHANFIINTGQAQAKDVIYLVNLIKKKIKREYKIKLEEEIQYFGT